MEPFYFAFNFVHQEFRKGSVERDPLGLQASEGSAGLVGPDGLLT